VRAYGRITWCGTRAIFLCDCVAVLSSWGKVKIEDGRGVAEEVVAGKEDIGGLKVVVWVRGEGIVDHEVGHHGGECGIIALCASGVVKGGNSADWGRCT
jgi:hypothetical protein